MHSFFGACRSDFLSFADACIAHYDSVFIGFIDLFSDYYVRRFDVWMSRFVFMGFSS
jgi:hypothetical protein